MARLSIGADEKKKLLILGGLLAAIVIVIVVLYVLPGGGTGTEVADAGKADGGAGKAAGDDGKGKEGTPAPGAPGAGGAPSGAAPAGAAPAGAAPAPGGGGGGLTAASFVSVTDFREDPFAPFPLPAPVATPEPPAPPRPIDIASPTVVLGSPDSVPPFRVPGVPSSTPPSRLLPELPPLRFPTAVQAPTAPTIVAPTGDGGGGGAGSRSPGKRLSGVIIGDSVRALLVIESGDNQTPSITRIVQPGDEVEGIRILRIERTNEGGRPVTRMFIRENGEERFVDLRPAPQQTGAGGAGGPGGAPGAGGPPRPPRPGGPP